jgi:hypothetical protein
MRCIQRDTTRECVGESSDFQVRRQLPSGVSPEKGMRHDVHNPVTRAGKIGWIVLWLLGIPIPVLLILFLIRGCT